MLVLILERVAPKLRGELSRWLIEPRVGVFVGQVSALVREKLWDKIRHECGEGGALLIQSGRTEQGFQIRSHGDTSRQLVDMEGLTLVRIPAKTKSTTKSRRTAKDGPAPTRD